MEITKRQLIARTYQQMNQELGEVSRKQMQKHLYALTGVDLMGDIDGYLQSEIQRGNLDKPKKVSVY